MTRPITHRLDNSRVIKAATGPTLAAKSWLTEAPLRMLMNNLHPDELLGPLATGRVSTASSRR